MTVFCAKNLIKAAILVGLTMTTLNTWSQLGTVTRGPYIQMPTSTSVTLKWITLTATDSKVTYGTNPLIMDQVKTVSASATDHTVVLTGLLPYTKYYYTIGSSTAVLQSGPDNHFLTSPTPGTEGKYTFWVTGDCGNNSTNQKNVLASYNTFMGDKPTNGWLTLGDNAYSSGLDLEFTTNFFNIYQENIMKHAPLWPVPGNHDYGNIPTNQIFKNIPYFDIFDLPSNGEAGGVASNTEAFYSYDYGNIHFLALDSYGQEDLIFRLYDTLGAQAQWIKQDLAANTKPWVIAYWHHPPYTMASHNSDTESELKSMRASFMPFLENLGVDMVLCGHSHGYERSRPIKGHYGLETTFDGTTHNMDASSGKYDGTENSCTYMQDEKHTKKGTVYIVAGSAGQLGGQQTAYPHNAMYFSDVTNGGSLVLEVEANRLDAKWLNTDGAIRDNFTIIKGANKETNITINRGQSVTMKASWPGEYNWSNAGETSREITLFPSSSKTYSVTDQQQCITDVYNVTVQEPSGLDTKNNIEALKLYPNPATSELTIEANYNNLSGFTISDITGRVRIQESINEQNSFKKKVSISDLPKGIYLVKISNKQGTAAVQKLIVE